MTSLEKMFETDTDTHDVGKQETQQKLPMQKPLIRIARTRASHTVVFGTFETAERHSRHQRPTQKRWTKHFHSAVFKTVLTVFSQFCDRSNVARQFAASL